MFDLIVAITGIIFGFIITEIVVLPKKIEEVKKEFVQEERLSLLREEIIPEEIDKEIPKNFEEFMDYISKKYMLLNATLSNAEGLLIASNSVTPEKDAAVAVEVLKKVSDTAGEPRDIVLNIGEDRTYIFKVNIGEGIIVHLKSRKDLSSAEIKGIKKDLMRFMEEYV